MIPLRPIAGMILGSLLLLAPGLACAQDNPWYVPPAAAPGYGGAQPAWQGGGGGAAWREPSYAPSWPQERSAPAHVQARVGDAGGLNAVAALGASAIARGANRDWGLAEQRRGAGYPPVATPPPLILGEFPPLDVDVTVQPPPRHDSRRSETESYARPAREPAYETRAYAPPGYEPRGPEDTRRSTRRETPPAWSSYPPPLPPGPSTLGGGWGGPAGGYGAGGYGSYAYPYAGGYPATYGWF